MIKKRRSVIPNIFTMANMVMGFFGIIFATMGGHYLTVFAGSFIILGAIFDALDGAVARALHVESPIGLQLDSLADSISYGIAPGVIIYLAFFSNFPEIAFGINYGMLLAPIYPICALYRLARFNVDTEDHGGFSGLPSPAAGIFVSTLPMFLTSHNIFLFGTVSLQIPIQVIILLYLMSGFLMVSKFEYNKIFSDIYKKGKVFLFVTIAVLLAIFVMFKLYGVFIVTGLYILAGICLSIIRLFKNKTTVAAI